MSRATQFMLMVLSLAQSGCITGYRHQWGSDHPIEQGVSADVNASADVFWAGVVFDVRFVRLLLPTEEFVHNEGIVDDRGAKDATHARETRRTLNVDVPLLRLWSTKEGVSFGYPPLKKMRKGQIELWASGGVELQAARTLRADLSVVYYHAPWVAFRVFGGWQSTTYEGSTRYIDEPFPISWEGRTSGPSVGGELTLFAGEYALNVFAWMLEKDEKHRRQFGD
jgi:hypothetical protein